MNARAATCPPKNLLSDFGLGKLDDGAAETLSAHLETCADCRAEMDCVASDSFVDRMRQAVATSPGQSPPEPAQTIILGAESVSNAESRAETPTMASAKRELVDPAANLPPALAESPDFEVIKVLGQGGMGVVYLARNRMMDRLEVLKVVNKALLDRPGAVERFQQEIRSAARLLHHNIVAAHSVPRLGDLLVFAMEYVDGQDLSQVVKRRGPLPITNATFYAHQVALGLQHAHEKGMVHRDIKPSNLMLAIEGKKHVVKILDFGLAKATSEKAADAGLTKTGQMLGTPDYIAPEQTLDAQKADIRADIYSLGCTLYFMLSGHSPFQGNSLYEILQAHHQTVARPLNLERPEVPAELAGVVSKMMAKAPAQRFQTPIEVAKALNPFFKGGTAAGHSGINRNLPPSVDVSPSLPPPIAIPNAPMPVAMPVSLPIAQPAQPVLPFAAPVYADPLAAFSGVGTMAPARPKKMQSFRDHRVAVPVAIGLLLVGAVVFGAVMFKFKTADGVVAIEANVDNPEVFVDGNKATITWGAGGKKAEITLPAGTRKIELKKDGFKAVGETVELESRGRRVFVARLEPLTTALLRTEGGRGPGEAIAVGNGSAPAPVAPGAIDPKLRHAYMNQAGVWSIEGDELVQEEAFGNCSLVFGDFTWKDYDFAVEVKKVGDIAEFGLVYHASGAGYSSFFFKGNKGGYGGSMEQSIWTESKRSSGTWENDRWYKLGLRLRGPHCQCFLGDQLVAGYEEKRNPQGGVGLWTSYGTFHFRNLLVTDPGGKVLFHGLPQLPASNGQWPMATEPASSSELQCLKGHNCPVTSATFSRDGRQILSCSDGETMGFNARQGPVRWYSPASSIRLWEATTGKELASSSVNGARGFLKLATAPAGPYFVTHIRDANQVGLWSVADGKIQSRSGLPASGRAPGYHGFFDLGFVPDGRRVRALSQDTGSVWEWDVADRIFVRHFPGTITGASCTAMAPDASRALLARRNQPFAEVDLDTGKEAGRWTQTVGIVRSMAFAPDGRRVVTGGEDGTIRLWETADAKHLHIVGTHPRPVLAVAISSDGRRALTGGDDQTVRLWDLDGKKELAFFPGHTGAVLAVAFSPDGLRGASGSRDYTLRIWRLPSAGSAATDTTSTTPITPDDSRPPHELLHAYRERIKAAWPGREDRLKIDEQNHLKLDLHDCQEVHDLTPLAGMRLHWLSVRNCKDVRTIAPLHGLPLVFLDLRGCEHLTSIEAVKGMPLEELYFDNVSDLRPLTGLPLRKLVIWASSARDIRPLTGMPLNEIEFVNCGGIADLSPLVGMPLTRAHLWGCVDLRDLTPLKGMKLTYLDLFNCVQISDLSPLAGMPLTSLDMNVGIGPWGTGNEVRDISPLRGLALSTCLLGGCAHVKDFAPVVGMPLKELALPPSISNDDLGQFRSVPLKRLELGGCVNITDLTPTASMPLEHLNVGRCERLADLTPLAGKKLRFLSIYGTAVSDISSLRGMALDDIRLTPSNISAGIEILRNMPSLRTIGISDNYRENVAASEFWRRYDAGVLTSKKPAAVTAPSAPYKWPPGTPPPAIAPFDAKQARAHQEAWAKHRGLPVEQTNSIGMKLVLIPPGEFMMGPIDWGLATQKAVVPHRVTITKPYGLGMTEVTVGQFKKFVEAAKYVTLAEQCGFGDSTATTVDDKVLPNQRGKNWRVPGYAVSDDSPVTQVTWDDAVEFCNWLSEQEHLNRSYRQDPKDGWVPIPLSNGYRLPTDAEWEYACRGGTTTQYSFGDDPAMLNAYCWSNGNAQGRAWAVGLKLPNAFGLFDMHGNVWECCQDKFARDFYSTSPAVDPIGPSSGRSHVRRGANWSDPPLSFGSAMRHDFPSHFREKHTGFRVVRVSVTTGTPVAVVTSAASQPNLPVTSGGGQTNQPWNTPAFQAWMKTVTALPAEKQVEAVSKKLMELNPRFDGKLGLGIQKGKAMGVPKVENGVVTELQFFTDNATDISPVRALTSLTALTCGGTSPGKSKLCDLSPLQGMKLTKLECRARQVFDLSPLQGMKLTDLDFVDTQVSNLSPLQGMPLRHLDCVNTQISDLSSLQSMPLTQLYCNNTLVSDLSPLADCKNRGILGVKSTRVTAASVAALQKAVPNCKIDCDDPAKPKTPQPAATGSK